MRGAQRPGARLHGGRAVARFPVSARVDATGDNIDWLVQIDSTVGPGPPARSRDRPKRGRRGQDEPDDHALGRSRGGLTTKVHLACDGKGRPLAILVTPGRRHDGICARTLLERFASRAPALARHAAGPRM
ncbi:transposase [Streptomyces sp. MK37H]|uniref:transposase n=1 Tax=Streptomyces sp. MK37H TaxID=2699117 RepID=UPI0035A93130